MTSRLNSIRSKTVLIAEDDDQLAQIVAEALEEEGFRTQRASDGIAALNAILETRPDVILLDLMLPRLQGYDICGMVRKTSAVHQIPIVVISGRSTLQDRLRAFELGADDYVIKPFELDELLARVEAIVLRSRQKHFPTPFTSGEDIE
jgi:DNA-binding response OmpR family regulator